jgi:hypothetical protein
MKRYLVILFIISLLSSISVPAMASISNPQNEGEFYQYLQSQGIDTQSRSGKSANFNTYKVYDLIVYGDPWGDTKYSSGTARTEARYLGYDFNDSPYTNPQFPADVVGPNPPEAWNYIIPGDTSLSWSNITPSQKRHMLGATLTGNGAGSIGFNVSYIGGQSYARIQNAPVWRAGGSVYTKNRGRDGRIYYATFSTAAMVGNALVSGQLTTPMDTYTIHANEDSVTVPVKVTANANISGFASTADVASLQAAFKEGNNTGSQVSTISYDSNLILSRTTYNPGTYDIPLDGTVSLSTIFNENDSKTVSKTIKLIVESQGPSPYVVAQADANPSSKEFQNQDIPVTVTVKGTLKNNVDTSKISYWQFFARYKEDTVNYQQSPNMTQKVLTQSAPFNFTIPVSRIMNDQNNINFATTARVFFTPGYLKRQFNMDVDYLDAQAETSTLIYKTNPAPQKPPYTPTKPNIPPVAVISAPPSVRAGDYAPINGSGSYDPDGTIDKYSWSIPYASGTLSGENGSVQYMREGTYTIGLTVTDNVGASDSTSKSIVVTPPTPVAWIDITGSLKENRKFTIDSSQSNSPSAYPIITSRTEWTITPISGTGTASDVKYTGVLNGNVSKDILIKKAGDYKVTLTVFNSRGSDTTEKVITIQPDLKPNARFTLNGHDIYRNPVTGNFMLKIYDNSTSPDGDPIAKRVWYITFDSNNDGNFDDETPIVIDSSNRNYIEYITNHVGLYKVELEIFEDFGQPTIPDFITPADHRSDRTW